MTLKAPDNLIEVISEQAIAEKVSVIAAAIDNWIDSLRLPKDKDIVAMPIMRGAMYFFSDLTRDMSHSVDIVPVRTWGYVLNTIGEKSVEIRIDLAGFDPKGKTILLVDEICDSGRTLKVLSERLLDAGAKEIKSTTLIHRMVPELIFSPNWVGFQFSEGDWLVGYGMEDCERFRNLRSIYKKVC